MKTNPIILCAICLPFFVSTSKAEQKSNDEISKELSSPVSNIINLPFQMNWDDGGGPKDKGQHYYLKIQPVIPVDINENWRVVSRSIISLENKHNFGYDSKSGTGDLTQSFFFLRKRDSSFKFGLGPAFLIPTGSENELGEKKWGAGPTIILENESNNWTIGVLSNHIWSFTGKSETDYVNRTFVQPFITRHFSNAVSATLSAEYTYDWHDEDSNFPVNLNIAKVVNIGNMPVSFSLGGRYYVETPAGGPDWGLRATVTFVLPSFN